MAGMGAIKITRNYKLIKINRFSMVQTVIFLVKATFTATSDPKQGNLRYRHGTNDIRKSTYLYFFTPISNFTATIVVILS